MSVRKAIAEHRGIYWVDGMAGMEATDKAIGPAIALKVNGGDKVQMETWTRYEEKISYEGLDVVALASMLGGTFTNVKGFEGYTQNQTSSSLLGAFNAAEYPDGSDNTLPNAYLNYIVYDDNMVYQDAGWVRVSEDAGFEPGGEGAPNERLHNRLFFNEPGDPPSYNRPVEINQNGYIYIWVSNQSEATKVWFDDLKVTHTQNLVVQATDYGVWGDVLREQKTDELLYKYRFGYQGQFAEKDEETGWNHFELREYDPVIGRWTAVDPKRQFFSPYVGMGNSPISGGDPDGGGVNDIILNGTNGSSLTIVTEIDATYNVDYDFGGNLKYDASNVFIGINRGISALFSPGVGFDASLTNMSGIFLGGDYAYYPYDYLIGEFGQTISTPEVSVTSMYNLVIGFYKGDDPSGMTPGSIVGSFTYFGEGFSLGTPIIKLSAGVNYQNSVSNLWNIHEFGILGSFGTGLPVSGQIRSNIQLDELFGYDAAGTGTWLLNRGVQKTSDRSWLNLLTAPFLSPGSR